ncbi:MAG TPA: L,D-transpeptidase family protein [Cytophagaceae bacterium]|jgi:murein L,D-transpeptidase YafK
MKLKKILVSKFWFFILLIISLTSSRSIKTSFKESQLKNKRVQDAYNEKFELLKNLYETGGIDLRNHKIFFRAFKEEKQLELWACVKKDSFKLIKTFDFCRASGCIGPKRKCGDRQVPEGFYQINRFNPTSNYFLSLGLNYPNASDLIKSKAGNPGGDIFIHGSCVSIGCISITDDKIKEVYIAAVEARDGGQKNIPIHIFPSRLGPSQFNKLSEIYADDPETVAFWKNLKEGYDYFEKRRTPPIIGIDGKGRYMFLPI